MEQYCHMLASLLRVIWGVLTGFLCLCLGHASSATGEQTGKLTEFTSNLAWDFAVKEGFRVFKEMPATKPLTRSHHTRARPQSLPRTPGMRSYVTSTDSSPAHVSKGVLVFSPEGLSPPVRELYQRLKQFMERHVYPAEPELQHHQTSAEKWTPSPLVEDLKVKPCFEMWGDLVSKAQPQLVRRPHLFPRSQWRDGGAELNDLCFPPSLERASSRSLRFTSLLFLCDRVSASYSARQRNAMSVVYNSEAGGFILCISESREFETKWYKLHQLNKALFKESLTSKLKGQYKLCLCSWHTVTPLLLITEIPAVLFQD